MAPKGKTAAKGVKRAAGDETSTASKLLRVDPSVQAVQDVIKNAEGLSESCKAMLLAILPSTLCVAKDERVPTQTRYVEMIAEIIESSKSALQAAFDAEEAKVAALEASKSQLEDDVTKARAAFNDAAEVVSSKKLLVQDALKSSKDAETSLKDAKEAQVTGDAQIAKMEVERRELQEVLETCLPKLCGEGFEAEAAARHRDAVMDILGRSSEAFESTLLMTARVALIKPPAERCDFDKMAIDTLQKNLGDYVGKLSGLLRASEDAKTARAAAVEAAAAGTSKAKEAEVTALNELAAANDKQKVAAEGLEAAKAAVQSFEPSVQSAVAERDAKQAVLTHFVEHNIKSFSILESKTANVVTEEIGQLGA